MPLVVEEYTSTPQPDGTMSKKEWTADPIKWPAHVKQLTGQEAVEAQQLQGTATHEVTGRYRPGLTREARFKKPDGTILNIVTVNNVEDRNITTIVRCREKV